MENYYLFCDGHHGVYSWQLSAKSIIDASVVVNPKANDLLLHIAEGPDQEDHWDYVVELMDLDWVFEEDGTRFRLVADDGDIWAVKEGEEIEWE